MSKDIRRTKSDQTQWLVFSGQWSVDRSLKKLNTAAKSKRSKNFSVVSEAKNKLETEGFQFERRSSVAGDDDSFMNRRSKRSKTSQKLPKSASEAHFLGRGANCKRRSESGLPQNANEVRFVGRGGASERWAKLLKIPIKRRKAQGSRKAWNAFWERGGAA